MSEREQRMITVLTVDVLQEKIETQEHKSQKKVLLKCLHGSEEEKI